MKQESTAKPGDVLARLPEIVERYIAAFDRLIKILIDLKYAWAWATGTTSARKYARAGYPYGKNTRGKKRWLIEMKRKNRGGNAL